MHSLVAKNFQSNISGSFYWSKRFLIRRTIDDWWLNYNKHERPFYSHLALLKGSSTVYISKDWVSSWVWSCSAKSKDVRARHKIFAFEGTDIFPILILIFNFRIFLAGGRIRTWVHRLQRNHETIEPTLFSLLFSVLQNWTTLNPDGIRTTDLFCFLKPHC